MMEEQDHREQNRDNARTVKWVSLLVVAIIATIFVVKNSQSVTVSYIFDTFDIPLVWALLAALALGFAAGWLTKSFRRDRD